jgi:hypothetical protein
MSLRDLCVVLAKYGALQLLVREARATGREEGRLEAWREANAMIADHRTRYDPKPVSNRERLRREWLRAGAKR